MRRVIDDENSENADFTYKLHKQNLQKPSLNDSDNNQKDSF